MSEKILKISEQNPQFANLLSRQRLKDAGLLAKKGEFGDSFDKLSLIAQENAKKYSRETIKGVIQIAKEDGFSDIVNEESLKHRMSSYEWYPTFESNPAAEHYGEYKRVYMTTNPILIEREEDITLEEKRERTYIHELVHIFAGKGWQHVVGNDHPLRQYKNGLRFSNGTSGLFFWLNEAIVEELTVRIFGKEHQRYGSERMLYRMLRDNGSMQFTDADFFRAYFEEPDLSMPPGYRMPETSRLLRKINKAYPYEKDEDSCGVLQGLDLWTRETGVISAIHAFENSLVASK